MFAPQLCTGIEKRDKIACQGIKGVCFYAFIFIATIAGSAKVLYIVAAAQYTRKDVINHQRHPNHAPRGLAILAPFISARSYLTRQRR